jgi:hypothetical protein
VATDRERRLGSSGVFKVIAASARRLKRALSAEGEEDLPPRAEELATKIAQAFIGRRFGDVHAMGNETFQQRTLKARFEASWVDAVRTPGQLTGFEISNAGAIDLAYIPGLEDIPQHKFIAFAEIVFSSPELPLEHEKAFAIGAVLIDENGVARIGALHAR